MSTIALYISSLKSKAIDLTVFTVYFPSSFEILKNHAYVRDAKMYSIFIWLFWVCLVAVPMKVSEARIFVLVKQLYSVMMFLLFRWELVMIEISPVSVFHPAFVAL